MAAAGRPLFDRFLVVHLIESRSPPSDEVKRTPEFSVVYTAPHAASDELSPAVATFCFPDADELLRCEEMERFEAYTFILTRGDGQRCYGYCRRFLPLGNGMRFPECICLISSHRLPGLFGALMETLQVRWTVCPGSVFPFLDELRAQELPPPGKSVRIVLPRRSGDATESDSDSDADEDAEVHTFQRVDERFTSSVRIKPLFNALSIDNVLLLFSALLCEQRILFASGSVSVISECIDAALEILCPFEWQQVCIPVVPPSLLSYACAPMPFVMGVTPHNLTAVLSMPIESIVVVKLDENSIQSSQSSSGDAFDFPLPSELTSRLRKELKSALNSSHPDRALSDAFIAFHRVLFSHCVFDHRTARVDKIGRVHFDSDAFVALTEESHPELLDLISKMSNAQMFEHFVTERLEISARGGTSFDRFSLLLDATRKVGDSYRDVVKKANELSGAKSEPSAAEMAHHRSKIHAKISIKSFGHFADKTMAMVRKKLKNNGERDESDEPAYPQDMEDNYEAPGAGRATHSRRPTTANGRGAEASPAMQTALTALELTSNSEWTRPARDMLDELCTAAYDSSLFHSVCDVIWERLRDSSGRDWRHGYRGLGLLDYLLRHSSDRVVLNAMNRNHLALVDSLVEYEHSDEVVCNKVRRVARKVQQLLMNIFVLRAERKYAQVASLRDYLYQDEVKPAENGERRTSAVAGVDAVDRLLSTRGDTVLDLDFFSSPSSTETQGAAQDATALARDFDGYRGQSLVLMLQPPIPNFQRFHSYCDPERRGAAPPVPAATSDDLASLLNLSTSKLEHAKAVAEGHALPVLVRAQSQGLDVRPDAAWEDFGHDFELTKDDGVPSVPPSVPPSPPTATSASPAPVVEFEDAFPHDDEFPDHVFPDDGFGSFPLDVDGGFGHAEVKKEKEVEVTQVAQVEEVKQVAQRTKKQKRRKKKKTKKAKKKESVQEASVEAVDPFDFPDPTPSPQPANTLFPDELFGAVPSSAASAAFPTTGFGHDPLFDMSVSPAPTNSSTPSGLSVDQLSEMYGAPADPFAGL